MDVTPLGRRNRERSQAMGTRQPQVRTLTQHVTGRYVASACEPYPVAVELGYSSEDPYAVRAVFRAGASSATWLFARDLLHDGLLRPIGEGDIRLRPCLDDHGHAVVMIELSSDSGTALMQLPAREVATFVDRMQTLVAPGTEVLDVDAVIAAICTGDNV
jgi:hypothetical protein